MKVLFLDVDGVLNNRATIIEKGMLGLCDNMLELLSQIIEKTDAKIVLSSTWRLYPQSTNELKIKLYQKELKIFDKTIEILREKLSLPIKRKEEINEWLERNEVDNFAILDDDSDAEIKGHFFQTNFEIGLTKEIADEVINHLK